jgi:hypothetical protein
VNPETRRIENIREVGGIVAEVQLGKAVENLAKSMIEKTGKVEATVSTALTVSVKMSREKQ